MMRAAVLFLALVCTDAASKAKADPKECEVRHTIFLIFGVCRSSRSLGLRQLLWSCLDEALAS